MDQTPDMKKFCRFVISAHRQNIDFSESELKDELVRRKFRENVAVRLARAYARGWGVLQELDER